MSPAARSGVTARPALRSLSFSLSFPRRPASERANEREPCEGGVETVLMLLMRGDGGG